MTSRPGFTLIELLVVISVIAILASMLMVAIGLVRRAAWNARCQQVQHQGMLAITGFINEHESFLPLWTANTGENPWGGQTGPNKWYDVVTAYMDIPDHGDFWDKTWNVCPARADKPHAANGASRTTYIIYSIWAGGGGPSMRAATEAEADAARIALPTFKRVNETVALTDGFFYSPLTPVDVTQPDYFFYTIGTNESLWRRNQAEKHSGRANYAFFDGHVESIAGAEASLRAGTSGEGYDGTMRYFLHPTDNPTY